MLDQLDENDSLLDVGCGLGQLADFSRSGGGWKGDHTGVDISQVKVSVSRHILKTESIFQTDILTETYEQEHSIVAFISTLQEKTTYGNQDEYLQRYDKENVIN